LEKKWQILFKISIDIIGAKYMEEDEINYRTLRKIQEMEKNSPVLTDLKSDFYNDLSEYIENLKNRFESETSSHKQALLREEIENTKKIAFNIYEQREKKILLATASKVRGGDPDLKNLINIEKDLFDSILNLMLKSREKILEIETKEKKSNDTITVEPKKEDKIEEKQGNYNPIVLVTQDIPEFIGTDEKKYNLRNNDVLSLPQDMSEMLSKRGVVKKIKN
jgi:DNA replication initiation complex subunit (GINS family)